MSFKGRLIHTRNQQHGQGQIDVYDNLSYRWLTFGDEYIQTMIHKKKPWQPQLNYLPSLCLHLQHHKPKDILILGAGGGALYHHIHHYYPGTYIDMVEKDLEMIEIAQQYFQINASTHHADAFEFIKSPMRYDVILIDLFVNHQPPEQLFTESFIKQCANKSRRGFSINLTGNHQTQLLESIYQLQQLCNLDSFCLLVEEYQNIVVHFTKEQKLMDYLAHLTDAQLIEKPQWHPDIGSYSALAAC